MGSAFLHNFDFGLWKRIIGESVSVKHVSLANQILIPSLKEVCNFY